MSDVPIKDTVDGVSTLADALTNNGGIVVIAAVCIVLLMVAVLIMAGALIYIYKKHVDSKTNLEDTTNDIMKQMLENVSKQLTEINTSQNIIKKEVEEVEEDIKGESEKDLVKLYMDTNMIFKDASRTALDSMNANRVAIYIFHNGNKSTHGLPFFKMSCINSVYKKRVGVRSRLHNAMPLHLFFNIVEALYDNNEYIINDVDSEIASGNFAIEEFVNGSEVKSLFIDGIRDNDDILCGFIVAEFLEKKNFNENELYDKIKDALDIMNGSIKYIISNDDFKHKFKAENVETEE